MDALNIAREYDSVQYIVIKIGEEQYGIDISFIDNIVRMQSITRVPHVQPYFAGVINIRGEVVPVMSLRLKMGLEADEYTSKTRIIIVKSESNASVGLIVDEVREVVTLDERTIDEVIRDSKVDETYINGIGKNGNTLISLLDLNTVISDKDNS
ncbi:MAG: purine-binding chemotaxis protein CheW [Lachnospiraceae bacterium]|nr:purine-binding chemotaxis protein CheW [Lachnospiraceae bacterium]